MRKLTLRDLLATLIVAAVVTPFIGYSIRGTMPFVEDPRGMAGVGIVGGVLAIFAFGRKAFGEGMFAQFMVGAAIVGIGFGVAALIAENTWGLLVPMVAGIVVLWALGVLHDGGYLARRPVSHH